MSFNHDVIVILLACAGAGVVTWAVRRWFTQVHVGTVGILMIVLPVAFRAFGSPRLAMSGRPDWTDLVLVIGGVFVLVADATGKLPRKTLWTALRERKRRQANA
jgi:hypothetical protein